MFHVTHYIKIVPFQHIGNIKNINGAFYFFGGYTKSLKSRGILHAQHISIQTAIFQVLSCYVWLVASGQFIGQCSSRSFLTKKQRLLQHSATFKGVFPTSSYLCTVCFIVQSSILKTSLFSSFIIFLFIVILSSKNLFINFIVFAFSNTNLQ